MPYQAAAVANNFLDIARSDGGTLDPMKVQKLVYFCHGWHLAFDQGPLSAENAQAWMYGPVFPELYRALKSWGAEPIQGDAFAFESTGGSVQWHAPRIDPGFASRLIQRVWDVYGPMSGVQLSQLTHTQDSPWYVARMRNPGARGPEIPNELIRQHFKQQREANGRAARERA